LFEEIASFTPKASTVIDPLSFPISRGKQPGKQALRFPQARFAEGKRFCFADGIGNEAFFVQSIEALGIRFASSRNRHKLDCSHPITRLKNHVKGSVVTGLVPERGRDLSLSNY
jgi:hypothetical protein